MKAYLIARVSTEDQADALPAQVYRLQDYSKRMKFSAELFEIQESAYRGDRQKFNEIIAKLLTLNEPIALVFDKVDRYSRDSSSDEVRLLNTLCETGRIELHFPSDSLVITKDSSAGQRLMLTMNTAFSQYYSNAISDNVKRRNEQLRRDGIWTGKAPTGYRNTIKEGKKWIDVDELESFAIKDAFEMYATGTSTLQDIKVHWSVKYGLLAPISTIDKILKNTFYYGVMQVKGSSYPHAYEALVAKEVFDKCGRIRSGYKSKPNSQAGLPFPYRGLITCSECGCVITFEIKKQKYTYGHCTQFKGKHGAQYVNEDALTTQFESLLKSIQIPEDAAADVLRKVNDNHQQQIKDKQAKVRLIQSEITKYEQRLDRLYDDRVDGKISDLLYERKSAEYALAIENHRAHLATFELSSKERLASIAHLLETANNAHDTFKNTDYLGKRKILRKVLSNSLLEGDQLRWKLKKPYELMAFCNNNSTWQGYVESNHGFRFWRPTH